MNFATCKSNQERHDYIIYYDFKKYHCVKNVLKKVRNRDR
jgi:hypothetical protein